MIRFLPLFIATVVFLSSCTTIPEEVKKEKAEVKCSDMLSAKEWVTDTIDRNTLLATKHTFLKGDKATVFMAAFNATPPKSNFDPDTIVIFITPTDPNAVVGFIKNDCMMSAHSYPLGVVSLWMKGQPLNPFSKTRSNKEMKI